jgi:hypothetical protein
MSIETIDSVSGIAIENKFKPNLEEIQMIYDGLEKVERYLSNEQYKDIEEAEALSEENKKEAAEAYHKDISMVAPDDAMMYYTLCGKAEQFSIKNMQFRKELDLEFIKGYYKHYLSAQK